MSTVCTIGKLGSTSKLSDSCTEPSVPSHLVLQLFDQNPGLIKDAQTVESAIREIDQPGQMQVSIYY